MTAMTAMATQNDFIRVFRRVKINDVILQADVSTWEMLLGDAFSSFLYMCIGHTCNSMFCEYVEKQIIHNDPEYVAHKNHVMNMFLYLAHLCVSVESLGLNGCLAAGSASDSYSLYFVKNVKVIYMKKAAEMIKAFCAHKRLVRVDKVLKYAQRTVIYTQLRDMLNKEVRYLIDFLNDQLDTARCVGDLGGRTP